MKFYFPTRLSILFLPAVLLLCQCKTGVPTLSETSCHSSTNDGSFIVKAWGYGLTNNEAVEAAKKNAVYDVLFKGVKSGAGNYAGCPSRPIIDDLSKRETSYFNKFFEKNGRYLQFVNLSTDNVPERSKVGRNVKAGIYVIVDHRRLQKQMEQDNQAKSLNSGF